MLKLFRPAFAYAAPMEAAKARAVHAAGVPTPAVLDEVEVDGRPGIVFERVEGPLLFERLRGGPDAATGVGRDLADLHATLLGREIPGLELLREMAARGRELQPEAERPHFDRRLAAFPEGATLCHGDFHPGNVIVAERPVVIDWPNAVLGPPAADVARTTILLRFQGRADARAAEIRSAVLDAYLHRIDEITPVKREEVARCAPFLAASLLRADPANPYREALERLMGTGA